MGWMRDETGLDKTPANYVPLTPLSHLARAAKVFADREALVYGNMRLNYRDYHVRVSQLASALQIAGVVQGDVVATLLPNIPAQAEAHFGVPAAGAVLNTINIRLDVDTIAYIFDHGEAKVVLCDSQFLPVCMQAIEAMEGKAPLVVEVPDPIAGVPEIGEQINYETFLATGDPSFIWIMPDDEWESLALNYTSGTTGRPKGVVYHHRGAYLMTVGTPVTWRMTLHPRYLTIVPLFHCNGWNHTWMIPMLGGTVVCCRDVSAAAIYNAIVDEGVTHFGGAPIVLNLLVNAKPEDRRDFDHTVEVFTAGAPPAPATLAAIGDLGFNVQQVYGLTETFGHVTECLWNNDWDSLPVDKVAAIKARQGVAFPQMEDITVMSLIETGAMEQVKMDGKTQGQIVIRGNSVMKGYLKNPNATAKAFSGGYFNSEDLAVQHPDGSMQIVDRAKDIIISGGENISSVEVEAALMGHPDVMLCAVVAMPDDKWGEVPCAFVELKVGHKGDAAALIVFTKERLAGFKCPKKIVFGELPKTSTGKVQKFELRKRFR
ncbi:MAG: AMP-binding protein [Octadecabacter sp.]|nr:AMP-binding protein [Octadecabacter sp.]